MKKTVMLAVIFGSLLGSASAQPYPRDWREPPRSIPAWEHQRRHDFATRERERIDRRMWREERHREDRRHHPHSHRPHDHRPWGHR